MLRTAIALLFAAFVAPLLSGCVAVFATGATVGTLAVADRRTFGMQTEDEGIEWKILAHGLEKYGDQKSHINQTSYNRRVLLSGEVPSEQVKGALEAWARGLTNVRGVWNELRVAPPASLQARSNDAFITSKVKGRFVDAGKFRANLVKVVTESGVVHLLGLVTRAEADAAIEIARTTSGARKVVDLMEIISPDEARQLDMPPPDVEPHVAQPAQVPGGQ